MWMNEPEVKIICDSQYANGPRLTTFQLKYWRPILPEMNTHRIFSRNAASSRAQSFEQRAKFVAEHPYVPSHWNAEQPGMVGRDEFSKEDQEFLNKSIQTLAEATSDYLLGLNEEMERRTGKKIHKQYLNRYLEPFTQVTQLVSSTHWDNFFKLRLASDAQPEIRDVAWQMSDLLRHSNPDDHAIHLPYVTEEDRKKYYQDTLLAISVARCARVSYRAYEGQADLEKDLALFERLKSSGHWSPFEHVAFADPEFEHPEAHRNYKGWVQYRSYFEK